jgi:hypothetical protein
MARRVASLLILNKCAGGILSELEKLLRSKYSCKSFA